MRRKKILRPVIDTLEPRIALSGWFSDFVDNLFGHSTHHESKPSHPAQRSAQVQTQTHPAMHARQERIAARLAAHQGMTPHR